MASPIDKTPWMEWLEALMEGAPRQSYSATFPPDRFYCLLDELPWHLIPRHSLNSVARDQSSGSLFWNSDCLIYPAGQWPEELLPHNELLGGFALQGSVVWVRDPAMQSLLPFWVSPQLEDQIQRLSTGELVPEALSETMRGRLQAANILVVEDQTGRIRCEHEARIRKASLLFRQNGYAPVTDLIHPFHIAALRRYYRYLIRSGAIGLGDGQSPRRYIAHNESVARFFHQHIATTLSAVTGEPIKPSYVYLASYLSGAELKRHTDREQCEFSVTLCLDFSPEPLLDTPWPIRLDTPTGTVTCYQALGDGLAYRGTRLPHYRDVLDEGCTSTSIFFHYVRADFTGSLD